MSVAACPGPPPNTVTAPRDGAAERAGTTTTFSASMRPGRSRFSGTCTVPQRAPSTVPGGQGRGSNAGVWARAGAAAARVSAAAAATRRARERAVMASPGDVETCGAGWSGTADGRSGAGVPSWIRTENVWFEDLRTPSAFPTPCLWTAACGANLV